MNILFMCYIVDIQNIPVAEKIGFHINLDNCEIFLNLSDAEKYKQELYMKNLVCQVHPDEYQIVIIEKEIYGNNNPYR